MSDQTPKTVSEGLLAAPLKIEGLQLQPLTLGLYLLLEKMDSPLLSGGMVTAKKLDLFRAVFVLAHPLADSLAYWNEGPNVFDAAVLGFADRVPIADLEKLGTMIVEHIAKAFAPAAKTEQGGSEQLPLAPPPPPAAA